MISMSLSGDKEVAEAINKLGNSAAKSIGFAAVNAVVKTFRNEGVKQSQGRVKLEWGSKVARRGDVITGQVGLGVGGYRAKVKRPHGVYLNNGTPTIAARHFVENSIRSAGQKAVFAMRRAAKRRLEQLTERAK